MADEVRLKNQGKEKPMDDLISRQAVLDLFKEYQPNLAVKVYEFGERLKALKPAPTIEVEPDKGWISVKDRLPEPRTWVMVYIKNSPSINNIKTVFYHGFGDNFGKDKGYCGVGTITHWMPLPEPPKGE